MSKLTDEATFSNQASTCLTLRIFFFFEFTEHGDITITPCISLLFCLYVLSILSLMDFLVVNLLAIVHLLRNSDATLALEPLLSDCKNLLRTFPRTRIEHVFREANQCADVLAKLGAKFSAMYVSFVIPPVVVVNRLALDREATSCNRLISVVG